MAAPADSIVITGIGMATALGGAVHGAAAARAGIVRTAPLDLTVFDEMSGTNTQAVGHVARRVTDGFVGLGRWVRLGVAAAQDLLHGSPDAPTLPPRTALLLGVPDSYLLQQARALEASGHGAKTAAPSSVNDEEHREVGSALAQAIQKHACLSLIVKDGDIAYAGADIVASLAKATSMLLSGSVDCCLVGAIESLVDPTRCAAAHALGLLHTADTPTGFMPGEAGAFLLIETKKSAQRRGARILAMLGAAHVASDPVHRFADGAPNGAVLARVIEQASALGTPRGSPAPNAIIGSLNGDEWMAHDWGSALTRAPRDIAGLPLLLPVASFGELGTALPIVAGVLATQALARTKGCQTLLVWMAGYDGTKASFVVTASQG